MNTAYNTTTTVQESRNRYNELLQAALKRINDRKRSKTAQESEEVTTTEPTATTPAQQSEPVATPENVTTEPTAQEQPEEVTATAPSKTTKTRRTKTASPKPLGRNIYVAAWDAYEADQRARLEKYWKRYSDKVCVNTYWADR